MGGRPEISKSGARGFKLTNELVKEIEESEDGADRHIEK